MAVKKATKDRKHTSRELEDHVVNTATIDKGIVDESKWEATQGEIHSTTHLEDDAGVGQVAVLRFFDFKANPEKFKHHTPSKQELFNAHAKQIEIQLWQSGLDVMQEVKPQVILSKRRTGYRIIVGALPRRSDLITWEGKLKAQGATTLSDIANDRPSK